MSVGGEQILGVANAENMKMPYEFLNKITDGFSEERMVGHGAFGVVYRGTAKDGQEIAVKKLLNVLNFDAKFDKEFLNLSSLNHPNVVKLVGFCNEEEEVTALYEGRHVIAYDRHRALCFEYMHNGSLYDHLKEVTTGFGWNDRYNIIKGICEGLKYLHMGETPILHFDLKPKNILLDINMVPKIADFGLSRLLGEENTKMTISSLGTPGYLPPEYIRFQIISKEFDIYSLGVIIIKVMVGSKGYLRICDMEEVDFINHVHESWSKRLQAAGEYPSLEKDRRQVKTCIELALRCIAGERLKRPNIEYIVNQLNETEKSIDGSSTPYLLQQGSSS